VKARTETGQATAKSIQP